ncbi:hypothetical protein KC8_09750 [Sphingomonas sp. KC8]|nr:hypothetical protein KC8_09750 [Sphingomonas sp. KC8]
MKYSKSGLVIVACIVAIPATSLAAEQREPRADAFRKLIDCRAVQESAARLACYDSQVAVLDSAEASNELVIVDQNQIRKTKKTLFGLSLPNLAIFDNDRKSDSDRNEELTEIESKIKNAYPIRGQSGRWIIILEDGARWAQAESRQLSRDPKPGMAVKIRKAAMGSYFANIDGQTAIRMRREN